MRIEIGRLVEMKKLIMVLALSLSMMLTACQSNTSTATKEEPVEEIVKEIEVKEVEEVVDEIPAEDTVDGLTSKLNHFSNITSCIIEVDGEIKYEAYFNDKTSDDIVEIYSVSKSILSALFGIALEEGYIDSLETPLVTYLPDYLSEGQLADITIEHGLTMAAGLESCDGDYIRWFRAEDWVAYAASKPQLKTPGEVFTYNTGLTHILAAALTVAVDMPLKDFADLHLFGPMGIEEYGWVQDPQGIYSGGFNIQMKPSDMVKFGNLFLNQGTWRDGSQLVTSDWVDLSTSNHISADDGSYYGYLWWLHGSSGNYQASGFGNQSIVIYPEDNTVIVITCDAAMMSTNPLQTIATYWFSPNNEFME